MEKTCNVLLAINAQGADIALTDSAVLKCPSTVLKVPCRCTLVRLLIIAATISQKTNNQGCVHPEGNEPSLSEKWD